jgi:predicted esterase
LVMTMRIAVAAIAFLLPSPLFAQVDRYDLGRRLRAMELAWEAATPENRKTALAPLKKVVALFFANRNAEAAEVLDQSRFLLEGRKNPSPAERWANSLVVRGVDRLLDPAKDKLTIIVRRAYDVNDAMPANTRVRLSINGNAERKLLHDFPISSLPMLCMIGVSKFPPGDHVVTAEILVDAKSLAKYEFGISVQSDWQARLDRLRAAIGEQSTTPTTARKTLQALVETVTNISRRVGIETDLPAARFLCEGDELCRAIAAGESFYGPRRAGEFWLTLATASGEAPVRLFVPEGLKPDKPVPLVVAMHGAGGSENMFFDVYGHGGTMRACKDRGWLMVATRAVGLFGAPPPVADIVDELAKMYPIDPNRVFVLGHSMGAAHTVAALQASPGRFAAAAALGGGGNVRNADTVKGLPIYVACGSEDFALSGAKSLCRNLETAGAKVTFKEYPAVEHVVIVQACLREMFAFFDRVAAAMQ